MTSNRGGLLEKVRTVVCRHARKIPRCPMILPGFHPNTEAPVTSASIAMPLPRQLSGRNIHALFVRPSSGVRNMHDSLRLDNRRMARARREMITRTPQLTKACRRRPDPTAPFPQATRARDARPPSARPTVSVPTSSSASTQHAPLVEILARPAVPTRNQLPQDHEETWEENDEVVHLRSGANLHDTGVYRHLASHRGLHTSNRDRSRGSTSRTLRRLIDMDGISSSGPWLCSFTHRSGARRTGIVQNLGP